MLETSQDMLYVTVAACIAVFTVFLVWIMYYIAQISKQSNEMITDFRQKMEELDETVQVIKEKVTHSVDALSSVGEQVGNILELIQNFTGRNKASKRKRSAVRDDDTE
jgi:predicted PurR-regulated permease PerM